MDRVKMGKVKNLKEHLKDQTNNIKLIWAKQSKFLFG